MFDWSSPLRPRSFFDVDKPDEMKGMKLIPVIIVLVSLGLLKLAN